MESGAKRAAHIAGLFIGTEAREGWVGSHTPDSLKWESGSRFQFANIRRAGTVMFEKSRQAVEARFRPRPRFTPGRLQAAGNAKRARPQARTKR